MCLCVRVSVYVVCVFVCVRLYVRVSILFTIVFIEKLTALAYILRAYLPCLLLLTKSQDYNDGIEQLIRPRGPVH